MAPLADCLNHNHMGDSIFYMVNKDLHVEPFKEPSYFKGEKYLSNMSLIYQTDSEKDKAALKNESVHGFVVTEEFEQQQEDKSLVGWKKQINKDDI